MSFCREEVIVLPPSSEKRQPGFCVGKTEEAAFRVSRKRVAPDMICSKRSSQAARISRDLQSEEQADTSEIVLKKRVRAQVFRGGDHSTALSSESEKHETVQRLDKEVTRNLVSLSVRQAEKESLHGTPLLQWGSQKRHRSSRKLKHHSNPVRVWAAKEHSVTGNNVALALKERSMLQNAAARQRDQPFSPLAAAVAEYAEEESKWEKARSSDSRDFQRGLPVQVGHRVSSQITQQMHQQECRARESTVGNSPEKKSSSLVRQAAALTDEGEAGPIGKDFAWPKLVIQLSRKEKAEDFVIFKGCRLPLRPRRRHRAVEKALLYCTPGNWLSELPHSRYNVSEKKCIKEKPRGLKAMESMDTDSE